MAKATGKAASRPTLPRTSQVSLPSQIGAIEFMTRSRACGQARSCRACRRRDRSRRARRRRRRRRARMAVQTGTRLSVGVIAPPPRRGRQGLDRRLRPAAGDRARPPRPRAAPDDAQHGEERPAGIDEQIDRDIEEQRQQHIGAGERGRDRIRGAQQAVDRPRLAPDLGRGPAGDDGDEAEAGRDLAEPQIPGVCVEPPARQQDEAGQPRPPASAARCRP